MASNLTVMAVDDEPENLDFVERTLSLQYDVVTFSDPEVALNALKERPFDVIISDHRMPQMSGVRFLGQSALVAPEAVRILLTGFADLETAMAAVNEGRVSGFLRKPIDMDELLHAVSHAVRFQHLHLENRLLASTLAVQNRELSSTKKLLQLDLDKRSADLIQANAKLQELVTRDGLTGLYNHRYFQEQITRSLDSAKRYDYPLSLIFADVDWFKQFNDMHGHPAGDDLLMELAQELLLGAGRAPISVQGSGRLGGGTRGEDTVARYGGEEFVFLLPHTPLHGAMVVAERVRRAVESFRFVGRESQPLGMVTMSLGVAEFPGDAGDVQELIQRADEAMLHAKRTGRNRVVAYTEVMAAGKVGGPQSSRPALSERASSRIPPAPSDKIARLERAWKRERIIRKDLETLLEDKTRELYVALRTANERESRLTQVETEKYAMLGRLSAGIAHEFNNALNFVQGNLQHLRRYFDHYRTALMHASALLEGEPSLAAQFIEKQEQLRIPKIDKDSPKLFRAMETGVSRAARLVRDLGGFSRQGQNVMAPIDLRDTLDMAITLATGRLKERKVERHFGAVGFVVCDGDKIGQVVLNLLLNAADATAEGIGHISMRMERVGDDAVLEVSDNGPGIPPDDLVRLFEPFFTTKAPGKGTGLGLFICRQIAEEHKGKLWAENHPGGGASFFLSIPIKP